LPHTVANVIVKLALATELSLIPLLNPLAFTVAELVSENGALYKVELDVGSDPLVVYRIVAPDVPLASVTLTGALNVPPLGVIVGVATVSTAVPTVICIAADVPTCAPELVAR
jgi:hypothetical protein